MQNLETQVGVEVRVLLFPGARAKHYTTGASLLLSPSARVRRGLNSRTRFEVSQITQHSRIRQDFPKFKT